MMEQEINEELNVEDSPQQDTKTHFDQSEMQVRKKKEKNLF